VYKLRFFNKSFYNSEDGRFGRFNKNNLNNLAPRSNQIENALRREAKLLELPSFAYKFSNLSHTIIIKTQTPTTN